VNLVVGDAASPTNMASVGIREAFALDRHKRPGHHVNGKVAEKLIGEDGDDMGRMDPVAIAWVSTSDKEQTTSGRRKPGGGASGRRKLEGHQVGETQSRGWLGGVVTKREGRGGGGVEMRR
jgi:hypothetical protein